MPTARSIQIVLAVLVFSGLGAAPTTRPTESASPDSAKSVEQMAALLMSREAALQKLQKENAALEQQVLHLQLQLASNGLSRPAPAPAPMPDGWVARKFNGTNYYLVPLDRGQPTAPTTRPAGR